MSPLYNTESDNHLTPLKVCEEGQWYIKGSSYRQMENTKTDVRTSFAYQHGLTHCNVCVVLTYDVNAGMPGLGTWSFLCYLYAFF